MTYSSIKNVLWLIDENKNDLQTYSRELANALGNEIQIRAIEPLRHKCDYNEEILGIPKLRQS